MPPKKERCVLTSSYLVLCKTKLGKAAVPQLNWQKSHHWRTTGRVQGEGSMEHVSGTSCLVDANSAVEFGISIGLHQIQDKTGLF